MGNATARLTGIISATSNVSRVGAAGGRPMRRSGVATMTYWCNWDSCRYYWGGKCTRTAPCEKAATAMFGSNTEVMTDYAKPLKEGYYVVHCNGLCVDHPKDWKRVEKTATVRTDAATVWVEVEE